jgi:cell division protein FtsB
MYLLTRLRKLLWTRHSDKIFDHFSGIQRGLIRANQELASVVTKNKGYIAFLDKENAEMATTQARNEKLVQKIEDMLK